MRSPSAHSQRIVDIGVQEVEDRVEPGPTAEYARLPGDDLDAGPLPNGEQGGGEIAFADVLRQGLADLMFDNCRGG